MPRGTCHVPARKKLYKQVCQRLETEQMDRSRRAWSHSTRRYFVQSLSLTPSRLVSRVTCHVPKSKLLLQRIAGQTADDKRTIFSGSVDLTMCYRVCNFQVDRWHVAPSTRVTLYTCQRLAPRVGDSTLGPLDSRSVVTLPSPSARR